MPTIKTLMGINAYAQDDKIVADISEVNRVISQTEIIKLSSKIPITTKAQRIDAINSIFASFQESDLTKRPDRNGPITLSILKGFGVKTRILYLRQRLFFAPQRFLRKEIARIIFYFYKFFRVKAVFIVETDFNTYGISSMMKTLHYMTTYDEQTARKLILETQVISGVIPFPPDWLGFAEPFLVFSPNILAMPISRFDRTLFFLRDKTLIPSLPGSNSFESLLVGSQQPHSEHLRGPAFSHMSDMKVAFHLEKVISGINSLYRYSSNPIMFVNEHNEIEYFHAIQFQSLIFMLMADFTSLAICINVWTKNHMCFSGFDKIENLKEHFGNHKKYRWHHIFSNEFREFLEKIISYHYDRSPAQMKTEFTEIINSAYSNLWSGLKVNGDDLDSLKILKSFRNLTHGAFLKAEQFKNMFELESRIIPDNTLPIIFYFSLLAFILEPEMFVNWKHSTIQ